MWHNLQSAIQFLTILPCGAGGRFDPRGTMALFPIGGLLIGALLVVVDLVARMFLAPPAVAVVDVVALVLITGALHLDGLADTADGLYGRRPAEKALAIMKDSRIGSIGMVAVACCLAVKWAGLSGSTHPPIAWLLLIPAFARSTVLVGIRWLPYGRPDGGTGYAFFQQRLRLWDHWAVALPLILAVVLLGWSAVWLVTGCIVLTAAILLYYRYKINCITGDMLGAMIELSEAGLFLMMAAVA